MGTKLNKVPSTEKELNELLQKRHHSKVGYRSLLILDGEPCAVKVARTVRSGGKRPVTDNADGVRYLSLLPGPS